MLAQYIEFLREQALDLNDFNAFYASIGRTQELSWYTDDLTMRLNIWGNYLLPEIMPYERLSRDSDHSLTGHAAWIDAMHHNDIGFARHIINELDSFKFFLNQNKYHPIIAAWVLKKHDLGNKANTDIIFTQPDVAAASILLDFANIDIKTNWQTIKSDRLLRQSLLALNKYGINFSSDWDNLKHNKKLQQAIMALEFYNLDLGKYWPILKSNHWLAQEIARSHVEMLRIPLLNSQSIIFSKSCAKLQGELLSDLCLKAYKADRKKKPLHYRETYSYQQLLELTEMIQTINSTTKSKQDKFAAIDRYETCAKKKSSGWGRFGKLMATVICAGIGFVLGASVGAIAGGALGSLMSPGIGSITGAIIGAIAAGSKGVVIGGSVGGILAGGLGAFSFFSSSQEEKTSRHLARQGREMISHIP
jgi:hypothetical protein